METGQARFVVKVAARQPCSQASLNGKLLLSQMTQKALSLAIFTDLAYPFDLLQVEYPFQSTSCPEY